MRAIYRHLQLSAEARRLARSQGAPAWVGRGPLETASTPTGRWVTQARPDGRVALLTLSSQLSAQEKEGVHAALETIAHHRHTVSLSGHELPAPVTGGPAGVRSTPIELTSFKVGRPGQMSLSHALRTATFDKPGEHVEIEGTLHPLWADPSAFPMDYFTTVRWLAKMFGVHGVDVRLEGKINPSRRWFEVSGFSFHHGTGPAAEWP